MVWQDVPFLSLENQFISHLWLSFHAKFGHTDESFILVTKSKKGVSSHSSIFLMIQKKIQFQWHPHIGEIHTNILVYEQGRVTKHIKAPARVKVELPDLWKNRMVWRCGIGSNIFLKTGMTVVCLSFPAWHGSEYHYKKTKNYFTKSAIPHHHGLF